MPTTATSSSAPSSLAGSKRIFNFSAGPAVLPEDVIRQAQKDLWSIFDSGIGIMEHSHRGKAFDRVIAEAEADCRAIGNVPDDYEVLFLQGGATLQFAMIPMSFLPAGATADYIDTGVWTTKAIKEAKLFGNVNVAFDGSACSYDHTPTSGELKLTDGAAYCHYCSNNTIYGTRFETPPATSAPLIVDASSEMYSRPIDVGAHAMIYAGAQKNLGPSGVVLVIIRKDLMESARAGLPVMLDYKKQAAKGSRLNTPPTFGIYVMGQVFKWILGQGGLKAVAQANEAKARIVYDAIMGSGDFYAPVARPECRSRMNIPFRTGTPELDAKFISEALEHGMSGLKGHRDVGGLRASIYNAFPAAGCTALAEFMKDFAQRNG
ncbi:MAG: 3-phosphoserine/phosphohydroxythreonine transaminase [Planctomycetes bacterium]|nr:3-phosphoserine/phosphohydroxythreonine transaminase [Planctomycetota bacterium]